MPQQEQDPNTVILNLPLTRPAVEVLRMHLINTIDIHTMPAYTSAILTGIVQLLEEDPKNDTGTRPPTAA